jgi:hypothetical protein
MMKVVRIQVKNTPWNQGGLFTVTGAKSLVDYSENHTSTTLRNHR